jgi:DNA invertase Pin-like site-specific DNA recombinase
MKRAVLYLRVSTLDQTTANQERELRQVADRAGWEVIHKYKDHGISGAKGKDKRPAFNALRKAAARREFDVVMAWSVDRLGRSLQDLVAFLSEIHAAGVDLFLYQQGIDTTTPGGKAMFQMLGVFAEFERSIIQERVRAGLRRAKAEGKRLGRPRIAADIEARISAERLARIPATASVRSRHGSASMLVLCSGSVALSTLPHNATPQIALTPTSAPRPSCRQLALRHYEPSRRPLMSAASPLRAGPGLGLRRSLCA